MEKLGFFTAVSFGDKPQSSLERVDDYFYLGGRKARVIPGNVQQEKEGVIFIKNSSPFLLTALKVVSYLTVIIPIVMLITKAILRSKQSFYVIDIKQKLEEGIDVSQATKKIQGLMTEIQYAQENTEITWLATKNNRVFSLSGIPNLIFKCSRIQDAIETRFANMIKAQEVCLAHKLDHLVVPHAKVFNVDEGTFIAEERMDINPNESAQEKLYHESGGLDETVRQLVTFIAKTGFSDVEWRNIPIIENLSALEGPKKVALIDLEEVNGADVGIFGGVFRRGLIHCLFTEEQIDIALAEAERHRVVYPFANPEQIKASRLEEVQTHYGLLQFYQKKGILENPLQPVHVDDLSSLGLNLEEQGLMRVPIAKTGTDGDSDLLYQEQHPITLREAVVDVIAHINDQIAKRPEDAAIKGRRHILLEVHSGNLREYSNLGLPRGQIFITKEDEKKIWLQRIIEALVAKGHLFKLEKVNGHGYFIQA